MPVVGPNQPVMGYSFGEPELVPGMIDVYLDLIQWVTDDPDRVLILREGQFLETVNIRTGDTKSYNYETSRLQSPDYAIWLPDYQEVAYLRRSTDNLDVFTRDIWLNNGEMATKVITGTQFTPLTLTPGGDGLIDEHWQLNQIWAHLSKTSGIAPTQIGLTVTHPLSTGVYTYPLTFWGPGNTVNNPFTVPITVYVPTHLYHTYLPLIFR